MGQAPASRDAEVLHVEADRVVVGQWSGRIVDLAGTSGRLRGLLRDNQHDQARSLLRSRTIGEQAALVAMDENPEELLSLTAMDDGGKPGYRADVVAVLPAEVLTELVAPRNAVMARFNVELIKSMPAETFARSVSHTIDPIPPPHFSFRSLLGMAGSCRRNPGPRKGGRVAAGSRRRCPGGSYHGSTRPV